MSEDRQTEVPWLEPDLLDHLRVEFGERGNRAGGFLETAQRLLEEQSVPVPKRGELVAYCLREALTDIPRASGISDDRRWRQLSRDVVKSFRRYDTTTELLGEGSTAALHDLRSAVNTLDGFHKQGKGIHEERLIALMIRRAGVVPLSSGTDPVRAYQDLLDRVNTAAHSRCTVTEALGYWSDCLALLRQFFRPPELRNAELDELALRHSPSDSDMKAVLRLAGTPIHLQRFLRRVSSPQWLRLFEASGVLNSRAGDLWWSACSAGVRLAETHRQDILSWLAEMHHKHGRDLKRARAIAHASYRLGGSALEVLLRVVRRYPEDRRVAHSGLSAALVLDATDRMVDDLADVLMNEASSDRSAVPERLAAHLAAGVDEQNALHRIRLLCFKLNNIPDDDLVLSLLRDPPGSIADAHSIFPHDRSSVLLGCLTQAVHTASDLLPSADLLASTSSLWGPLKERMRAWILANAPDADPDTIAGELEQAVASRDATGDDVTLVDRAITVCDRTVLTDRCRAALGDAPTEWEVSRVLASEQYPPERWMRAQTWVALLPEAATERWQDPCRVLAARFGEVRREDLACRSQVKAIRVTSPIKAEELRTRSPEQAASMIAQWRPDQSSWPGGQAIELARTLKYLVNDNPDAWMSDPVSIATKLHEPLYIGHYLGAVSQHIGNVELPVEDLLDVIQLVWDEPWPAVPLGRYEHDHSTGWRTAKRHAVDLIRALVNADTDFGHRADEVWKVIESAAKDQPHASEDSNDTDPMRRAINRSNTLAFETAILLVAAELRASRPVRPSFEELLEFSLRLEGTDGEEYRAILAPHIAWLRHVLPQWTSGNIDLLFGTEAPYGLAQLTIDLAVQRSQPNPWLLETYPDMIRDAVTRRVDWAMNHLLVGMLWNLSAYQIEAVVRFLSAEPESQPDPVSERYRSLASDAGIQLSTLVRGDEAESRHIDVAVNLWEALLESEAASSLEGFGWMSTVKAMDTDRWVNLTLRTLSKTGGRIDWEHEVADRAMSQPATITKLALLDQIIRGHNDDWVLRHIADNIQEFLTTASSLASTDEYQRLRTALLERGMIDD